MLSNVMWAQADPFLFEADEVASDGTDNTQWLSWSNVSLVEFGVELPSLIWQAASVQALQSEIQRFLVRCQNGWGGPDSLGPSLMSVQAMMGVLGSIPAGLMLPKTMLSLDGELGLYWDLHNGAYADVCVDRQGQITFFSRDMAGQECFQELAAVILDTAWYWKNIGRLAIDRWQEYADDQHVATMSPPVSMVQGFPAVGGSRLTDTKPL